MVATGSIHPSATTPIGSLVSLLVVAACERGSGMIQCGRAGPAGGQPLETSLKNLPRATSGDSGSVVPGDRPAALIPHLTGCMLHLQQTSCCCWSSAMHCAPCSFGSFHAGRPACSGRFPPTRVIAIDRSISVLICVSTDTHAEIAKLARARQCNIM